MSCSDWGDSEVDLSQYISSAKKAMINPAELDETIAGVMQDARRWADKHAKRELYPTDLGGLCAKAAAKLFLFLKKEGIDDVVLVETNCEYRGSHCYVLYQDRYILDITATQFGHRDLCVVVDTERLYDVPYYWEIENKFDSVAGLRKHQRTTGWPEDQIPR